MQSKIRAVKDHAVAGLTVVVKNHRGQNSKQIIVAKYISKFLIYDAKMLDKCVKSKKKNFVHCPFLQSQAK